MNRRPEDRASEAERIIQEGLGDPGDPIWGIPRLKVVLIEALMCGDKSTLNVVSTQMPRDENTRWALLAEMADEGLTQLRFSERKQGKAVETEPKVLGFEDVKQQVRRTLLRSGQHLSLDEIVDLTGCSSGMVLEALDRLTDQGKAARCHRSRQASTWRAIYR